MSALLGYIFCIAERHNAFLGFFVEEGFQGAKVSVSQPGFGIRFPTGRKHVAIVDEVIMKYSLSTYGPICGNSNGVLSKIKGTSTGLNIIRECGDDLGLRHRILSRNMER